jgi:hypothetical protein
MSYKVFENEKIDHKKENFQDEQLNLNAQIKKSIIKINFPPL